MGCGVDDLAGEGGPSVRDEVCALSDNVPNKDDDLVDTTGDSIDMSSDMPLELPLGKNAGGGGV